MFQVAYLICAPFVGSLLQKVGRKNMIVMGYCLCTTATVAFGACYHIPKYAEKTGEIDGKPIYTPTVDGGKP
jgi:MFS family permease